MKLKISHWLLVFLIVSLALCASGFFVFKNFTAPEVEPISAEPQSGEAEVKNLDASKEETHLSKVAETNGVFWVRAFDLIWNNIEVEKGKFSWFQTDEMIKDFNQREVYLVAIVKPFANWDQETCHPETEYEASFGLEKGATLKVGKPCDMDAYNDFLEKTVERYDGDGQDDMPGLSIPIKYWEIMNEPEMQGGVTGGMGEELKFFVGSSQDYLEILKTSYQTIKATDQEAKILPAGMAGMEERFQDFWRPVFENGGGQYFDIANIHTISTDERREDLFVIKFKKFLEKYNLSEKPIFITEVQFGQLTEEPEDLRGFEILLVKSSVFALAQGADKLFYIDNWLSWDEQEEMETWKEEKDKKRPKISAEILASSTHRAYLNLVNQINRFEKIKTIQEEYEENSDDRDGATSKIGQYEFISDGGSVYVLWGDAELPDEIFGKIKITDIYGESELIDASNLVLSDEPIFVETIQ